MRHHRSSVIVPSLLAVLALPVLMAEDVAVPAPAPAPVAAPAQQEGTAPVTADVAAADAAAAAARKTAADDKYVQARAAFQRASEAFRASWRDSCLDARVEYQLGVTDTPPSAVLRRFLQARQRGRPRA